MVRKEFLQELREYQLEGISIIEAEIKEILRAMKKGNKKDREADRKEVSQCQN